MLADCRLDPSSGLRQSHSNDPSIVRESAGWPNSVSQCRTCNGGVDFIVMECVTGKTLGESIGRKGLKLNDVLAYGVQIADALAVAHGAGIVHRDH